MAPRDLAACHKRVRYAGARPMAVARNGFALPASAVGGAAPEDADHAPVAAPVCAAALWAWRLASARRHLLLVLPQLSRAPKQALLWIWPGWPDGATAWAVPLVLRSPFVAWRQPKALCPRGRVPAR